LDSFFSSSPSNAPSQTPSQHLSVQPLSTQFLLFNSFWHSRTPSQWRKAKWTYVLARTDSSPTHSRPLTKCHSNRRRASVMIPPSDTISPYPDISAAAISMELDTGSRRSAAFGVGAALLRTSRVHFRADNTLQWGCPASWSIS
jgi:hypothetical protein